MEDKQLLKHCPFCGGELVYSKNILHCHNDLCNGVFKRGKDDSPYWKIKFGVRTFLLPFFRSDRYPYYRIEKEKLLSDIREKISKAVCDPDVLISEYDEQESVQENKYGVIFSIEATFIFKNRDFV